MWAKDTGLRELRDRAKKMKNEWKRPVVQFEEPGEEAKEMDGDADSRRKPDGKKRSQNSCSKLRSLKTWMRTSR